MIDFALPPDTSSCASASTAFVRDEVIPRENDPRQDAHGPSDALRLELVDRARAAGLLSPHAPVAWGGLGLDHRGMAVVFEAAGYSLLGPLALNIQAPDEGNTNLLNKVATQAQKERWLRPLVAGEIRTVFSMTEPDDGAGADPSLLKTEARADGDDFVIHGRKWLITGVPGRRAQHRHGANLRCRAATTSAPACSWSTSTRPDFASCASSTPSTPSRPAATPWSSSRACACRAARCSASSARACAMPRFGSARHGSRTACAGSARRGAPTTSPSTTRAAATPSAS